MSKITKADALETLALVRKENAILRRGALSLQRNGKDYFPVPIPDRVASALHDWAYELASTTGPEGGYVSTDTYREVGVLGGTPYIVVYSYDRECGASLNGVFGAVEL